MKNLAAAFTALLLAPLAAVAEPNSELWRTEGFEAPESALFDPARGRIIVSNIAGHPGEADGEGYLSLLSLDGAVLQRRWATGMDAPKGMAMVGDRLLVADLTALRVLDADSGELVQTFRPEGAKFLNDVSAAPDGSAFVTDFMDHAIYRYREGELSLWLRDPALKHPNGVLAEHERLVVGAWGDGMQADFTTLAPGGILFVDIASKAISPAPGAENVGNIDGVVHIGEALVFSDWVTGALYSWTESGGVRLERDGPVGLADIGAHGGAVLAPSMLDGSVAAWPLKQR